MAKYRMWVTLRDNLSCFSKQVNGVERGGGGTRISLDLERPAAPHCSRIAFPLHFFVYVADACLSCTHYVTSPGLVR